MGVWVLGQEKRRTQVLYVYVGGGGRGAGEAPYAGLKFCMYEAMKRSLAKLWGIEEEDLGFEP